MESLNLKNLFKTCSQHCWICQFPTFSSFEICRYCIRHLPKPKQIINPDISLPFKTLSLWEWSQNENAWCRELLYRLKNKPVGQVHGWLAFQWLITNQKFSTCDQKMVIVPSPRDPHKKFDHAHSLCVALSQKLGVEVLDVLHRNPEKQKNKTRQERKNIQIKLKHEISRSLSRVIFIDDVLTTGSTAKSAWQALGAPNSFEVWTLVYRKHGKK